MFRLRSHYMSERPGENKRDMPAGPQNTGGLQRSWDNPEQEPVVVVYVYQSVAISFRGDGTQVCCIHIC